MGTTFACSPTPFSKAPAPVVSAAVAPPPPAATPVVVAAAPSALAHPVDAKPTVPCSVDLDAPVASIDKVPSAVIARAIVPTLDTRTLQAKVSPATHDYPAPSIADCRGDQATVDWSAHDAPAPPPGKVEIPLRQPLEGGREAVWIISSSPIGACESHDGFVAIVHLEGQRVIGDAVAEWTRRCGLPEKFTIAKLGDDTVYVEEDSYATGEGQQNNEDLWLVRGPRLVSIGEMDVGHEGNVDSGRKWVPEMRGKSQFVGAEYIVHETWIWTPQAEYSPDAINPGPHAKVLKIDRKYRLVGDGLEPDKPLARPPMP